MINTNKHYWDKKWVGNWPVLDTSSVNALHIESYKSYPSIQQFRSKLSVCTFNDGHEVLNFLVG